MPVLEPVSKANGMDSADWPGLGHVPHPSLLSWQPGWGQILWTQTGIAVAPQGQCCQYLGAEGAWGVHPRAVLCTVTSGGHRPVSGLG